MSQVMMTVLYRLREAEQSQYPFASIEADPRTLRTLVQRDWIIASDGLDGIRYRITGRGLHALTVYEQPSPKRDDGLCPDCGLQPRMTYSTGRQIGYCQDCNRTRQNRGYAEKGNQLDPNGLCARCKKHQRHTYPSGHTVPYCIKCRKELRKKERTQKHKALLKRIQQGEFLPCYRCKEQPRYHTQNTVYDYCSACYRAYHNEYIRKWELKRVLKKHGKGQ